MFPLPEGERTVYQGRHPLGDVMAEKAITLVGQFLARAVKDGNDLDAREGMALAALLAGLAFSNVGVALVHALEYPLGGLVHCFARGRQRSALAVCDAFQPAGPAPPVRRHRPAAGGRRRRASMNESAAEKVDRRRGKTAGRRSRFQLGCAELNVRPEQLRPMAEKALGIRRILRVNPRPVTLEDLQGILEAAY